MLVSKSTRSRTGVVRRNQVVVIGAGVGGLVCAIELARSGLDVTVVEQASRAGGKLREVAVGGGLVDSGPTVFTMRWVFDQIFEAAGASLNDHLNLRPAEVLARHAWSATERLDLHADIDRSADAIEAFAGPDDAAGFRAFCAESSRTYQTLRDTFLDVQQEGLLGLARRVGLGRSGALMGLRPFETLWSALSDHFQDPRLRQLYGRYATYCGSSPFAAPATLMLIAHVEREGVWTIDGGMQRLAEALEAQAVSLGVSFRYSAPASRIEVDGGRATAVILEGGDRLAADTVVVNADSQALASGTFGTAAAAAVSPRPPMDRSLSAVTWSVMATTRGFPLTRHNVFFSGDYRTEFEDILGRGRLPLDPTVYVCAQDRDPPAAAPIGAERMLFIVNAPANGDRRGFDEAEVSACQTRVFDRLTRCGLEVDPQTMISEITTPERFNAMFPATGGALYGAATHGWASAFQRPGAKTRVSGLYLAGGGAHPGAGVPMAALSGRLAARQILRDRASMRPYRRVAISGGMSTP